MNGRILGIVLLAAVLAAFRGPAGPAQAAEPAGMIVYQTDFGTADSAVAEMKGVAKQVDRDLELFDNTHEIPAFDIWTAAFHLAHLVPYWPPGTVFVSVVDPGVGTERGVVAAELASGHFYVGPDNGTLTLVAEQIGVAALRSIDAATNRLPGSERSNTFHGRDIFSYNAARLASGQVAFADLGPLLEGGVVEIPYQHAELAGDELRGIIPMLDVNYGNVWTNIGSALFDRLGVAKGDNVRVRISKDGTPVHDGVVPFVDTFGDVPKGQPLLYLNSVDEMALAINYGSFAETHGIGSGPDWTITLSRP
ncbi:SAM hydrolase/SAM-dependent halogenase family protein [Geminicoccus roseus]|uniref:SAM hydrolase/SAM-dependent halogenase family protein n=1 Tax=Geminicoccus roseus TaxID=404900 RepID=UPI0003F653FC|nr:S-adenosyl-l-methionine hydroxide adenosyltransferase family protein [Geminicoccus roseus]